ncbi:MAG: ferredoxin [Candidatus Omnitrophica bacterium]|nr:ferredoxin [Candidatus Omnitrophota bacterium]MDD5352028.1 ferredoxin [Candidatus Omnitrophota bacterium]
MAVKVDKKGCNGCGIYKDTRTVNMIKIENDKAIISADSIECEVCANQCPNEAISI